MNEPQSPQDGLKRRGIYVFLALLVLTLIEFFVASSNISAVIPLMALIMIAKAAVIVEYFMHLRGIFQTEDEEGH